jgi:hypothetical protein
MIKTKQVYPELIMIEVAESIVCDVCKREYKYREGGGDIPEEMEIQEFLRYRQNCGYGSVFGDSAIITLDMCQYCQSEKLGQYIQIQKGSVLEDIEQAYGQGDL